MSRKKNSKSRRPARAAIVLAAWVRLPVKAAEGRRLWVLRYTRQSSSAQNLRSVKAQLAYR